MSQQQTVGVGQTIGPACLETSFIHQGGEDIGEEWEVIMGCWCPMKQTEWVFTICDGNEQMV